MFKAILLGAGDEEAQPREMEEAQFSDVRTAANSEPVQKQNDSARPADKAAEQHGLSNHESAEFFEAEPLARRVEYVLGHDHARHASCNHEEDNCGRRKDKGT